MLHTTTLCLHLLVMIQSSSYAVEKVIHNNIGQESATLEKHSWTKFRKNHLYNITLTNHVMKGSKNVVVENTPLFLSYLLSQLNRTVSQHDILSVMNVCPTWMYRINDNHSTCQCGSDLNGIVKCNKMLNTVSVLDCHCISYDEQHNRLVAGSCFYGCRLGSVYKPLPLDVTQVNNEMCGKLNRDGLQCAKCKHGYFPLVYSYDFHCINCTNSNYNWAKFVALAVIPSTLSFFVVIICKINALSPQLHGFVQISQAFGAAINIRTIIFVDEGYSLTIAKLISLPYGFVNLDFFRPYMKNICVDLNTLQTLALDYIVAVYPLFLVILSYILIELHARNCRFILWIWKPFRQVFSGNWDIHSSIIKTFATFLLLSYGKLLSVTFDLLIPSKLYNVSGEFLGFYLYYDASYKYFHIDHIPYAVIALVVTFLLLIPLPLLLLIYTMPWFHKCLKHRSLKLRTFVECFHGYFKDGTEPGTRDCRWIAATYFFLKILFVFILYGLTRNVLCYTLTVISTTAFGIVVIIVKPYKARYSTYNNVDAALLFLVAMWCASVTCLNQAQLMARGLIPVASILSTLIPLIPLAYVLAITIYWLYKTCLKNYFNRCKLLFSSDHRISSDSQMYESLECEREPLST